MNDLYPMLGHWLWWAVGALLLIGELTMPGFFLLWLAFAAFLTGIANLLFNLSWQGEIGLFCLLSALLVAATWRLVMQQRHVVSDRPNLNQRMYDYVGRTFPLTTAIKHGRGKVRIDDTLWDVEGPDLSAGTEVRITGVDGMRLKIEAAS